MISVSSTAQTPSFTRLSPSPGPLNENMNIPDRPQPSPAHSDDSLNDLPDLPDIAWERNAKGDWVRTSNGSSHSSPPPSIDQSSPLIQGSPASSTVTKRPSLLLSESVSTQPTPSARQFTRAASGPVASSSSALHSTPAASSTRLPTSTGLNSTARKISRAPRRVKIEDYNKETNERARADAEESRQSELRVPTQGKENAEALPAPPPSSSSKPLTDVVPIPQQRTLSAYGRQMISIPTRVTARMQKKVETIAEAPDAEEEAPSRAHTPALQTVRATRPRRSYSLSDTNAEEQHGANYQQYVKLPPSRGARRVTLEEKLRQEREIAREEAYAFGEGEESSEAEELERRALELANAYAPSSGSPTQVGTQYRPSYSHIRQESETMRSLETSASPTAVDPSSSRAFPTASSGLSVVTTSSMARHRRSPTAPESATGEDGFAIPSTSAKAWAATIEERQDMEDRRSDEYLRMNDQAQMAAAQQYSAAMPPPPVPAPVPLAQTQSMPNIQPQALPPGLSNRASVTVRPGVFSHPPGTITQNLPQYKVNRKVYARLDLLGKGGTSKVYRVMNSQNEVYAMKRVSLDRTDRDSMAGYMNEIALLKRLDGNRRIIRLIDSEVRAGPSGSRGYLSLIMECGEIDLAKLLQEQQQEPMDLVWVSYYWKQMLQAVHVIHEEKIVHSDLKPANFVLVKGQLKLIDFGIANAIANDTTNIQRDHQIGTLNYMSPEAIELGEGMRRLKVGRPSDIWSLGCILYQMIYGTPPFYHISNPVFKMRAIPDPAHEITFAPYSSPPPPRHSKGGESPPPKEVDTPKVRVPSDVIWAMMSCLNRNPKERATIPELLSQDWLTMRERQVLPTPQPKPELKDNEVIINEYFMAQLLQYGVDRGIREGGSLDEETLMTEATRLVKELQRVRAQTEP